MLAVRCQSRAAVLLIVSLTAATTVAGETTLRIATCNVHFSNQQFDKTVAAILRARADVVCLQETTPQLERLLQTKLKDRFPEFHATGHQGKIPAERFALLSTTPFRNVEFVPPRDGLFGFYQADVKAGDTDVRVVAVHLSPFLPPRNGGVLEGMAALAETEGTHAREIATVLARIDAQKPAVIAGDFNSLSTSKAPQTLRAAGFVDAAAAVHDQAEQLTTWRFTTPRMQWRLRIDFVFHSRHFTAQSADVISVPGSDHELVVVELRVVSPPAAQ